MAAKKQTFTPAQRAAKTARQRARRAELRATPEGAAKQRAQNAAYSRAHYARAVSTPEGLGKVRAKRNRTARARTQRDQAARRKTQSAQRVAQQAAAQSQRAIEATARGMVDDALEVYRALAANLRHWQAQANVPAPRIAGLQRSVAEAKRGVLEAQAYLLRVQRESRDT